MRADVRGDARHYFLLLDDLLTLGVAICREAAETCKERGDRIEVISTTVAAYCRASRGVRRAIMLGQLIGAPEVRLEETDRLVARRRIVREVEAAIARAAYPPVDAAFLRQELIDRRDAEAIDAAVLHLPAEAVIAAICRDLGIAMAVIDLPVGPRGAKDLQVLCLKAAGRPVPGAETAVVVDLRPAAKEF